MIILGVDPGTAITGYAVIKKEKNQLKLLECNVIQTDKKENSETRLKMVYQQLTKLIKIWRVEEVAVELLFFNTNAKTVLAVGESKGVIKLAAALSGLPVFEYTPLQVKMALTGYGRAEKNQVGQMVKKTFGLKEIPKPDDAADAVAIGLCHCYSRKIRYEQKREN